ncbi:hypothetical protein [Chachezhania sediminis]|uniref:hypothetical protein n=1 Tax=Chachezhania sediminis TaxID=2599291 RepID=UPI00131AFEA7|nr:hypothetical protein [Chachezhania sediminis]
MSDDKMRFRPMLIAEVARVAGDPRETIRTRLKQGVFSFERGKGWKRFTDFETITISIHARLKRATNDDSLAEIGMLLAAKVLMDEWIEDENGVPYFAMKTFEKDRFIMFRRGETGDWVANLVESNEELNAEINQRLDESFTTAPVFTCINLRTLLRQTLLAILKVQVEAEEGK